MTETVEQYLQALQAELAGSDSATIQDALADAEEHLRSALEARRAGDPELHEAEALAQIIEQYGTPAETAAAYREVEYRTSPGLALPGARRPAAPLGRFFGVYADPQAWGSLFYMLIALVTGVIYFTWTITGLTLSVSLAVLILGLPLALLFLLSIRGIAWLEGRLVEALLGVRMPRRPAYAPQNPRLVERLLQLALDKRTWFSMIYLALHLVLGTLYFAAATVTISFIFAGIAIPVQLALESLGVTTIPIAPGLRFILPEWSDPLIALASLLLGTALLHAVKFIGRLHGRFAKSLLVP
jgi:hypothetical protein